MKSKEVKALLAVDPNIRGAWAEKNLHGETIMEGVEKYFRAQRTMFLLFGLALAEWGVVGRLGMRLESVWITGIAFGAMFLIVGVGLVPFLRIESTLVDFKNAVERAREAGFDIDSPNGQKRRDVADALLLAAKKAVSSADAAIWKARLDESAPHSAVIGLWAILGEREKHFEKLYALAEQFDLPEGSRDDYGKWAARA